MPSSLRRARQLEILEQLDDLDVELQGTCHGSSPETAHFRRAVRRRLDDVRDRMDSSPPPPPPIQRAHEAQPRYSSNRLNQNEPGPEQDDREEEDEPEDDDPEEEDKHDREEEEDDQEENEDDDERDKRSAMKQDGRQAPGSSALASVKPKPTAEEKRKTGAQTRLTVLLRNTTNPAYSLAQFSSDITSPPTGQRGEREDQALAKIIRGYDGGQNGRAWRDGTYPLFTNDAPISDRVLDFDVHNNLSIQERLCAAHNAIEHEDSNTNTRAYVDYLIKHIHILSFGLDYNELTGTNSKKTKTAIYHLIYQNLPENKDYFAALSPKQRKNEMKKTHKKSYQQWWKRKMAPQVWARNHFVDIYLAFGPPLLLDPFWNVDTLTRAARTKEFPLILEALFANMPQDPMHPDGVTTAMSRRTGSLCALAGVAAAIDQSMYDSVRAFVAAHPDEVPRMP
ncbi:hypothetical protein C8R46DRAFT_1044279 [Mycena filopes]|nr:hypothetical protein C8R46DRAFT_1044279 [Mycena filopes]